jgi:hypothetical protein
VLVAVALIAAGRDGNGAQAGEPRAAPTRLTTNRFDARRAFAELSRQVRSGPRPAGSPASRALAERLRRALPRGRFEPLAGGLRNVVGSLPGRRPAIVIAAHYDTKDLPGFVGANDGASGTATVLELARTLARTRRPRGAPELRFLFFDGEESPDNSRPFYSSGLRGSRAYAARHGDEIGSVILLDFVGDRRLRIPRESSSHVALWSRLRAAARRVGAGSTFPDEVGGSVLDDHTPFLRQGIPAIDLIDFDFPCFHKRCDDLSAVSPDSLDRVGETVLELIRDLSSR